MKLESFTYEVKARVTFSKEDIDTLIDFSKRHYDGYCQSISEPGGFLYGFQNEFKFTENTEITVGLTFRYADTLCKVCEVHAELHGNHKAIEYYRFFSRLCSEINEGSRHVNASS